MCGAQKIPHWSGVNLKVGGGKAKQAKKKGESDSETDEVFPSVSGPQGLRQKKSPASRFWVGETKGGGQTREGGMSRGMGRG